MQNYRKSKIFIDKRGADMESDFEFFGLNWSVVANVTGEMEEV